MSRDHETDQQAGQTDAAAPAGQTADPTFGLRPDLYAQILQMSPADANALAEMIDLYPSFLGKILMVAAPHMGNAAVQRAIAIVKQMKSVTGAGGTMTPDEVRAQTAEPADARPVKSHEMTSFLHDESDGPLTTSPAATPAPAAAEPAWVVGARAYNTAHPDLVDEFDDLTHHAVLLDGETDPRAVARWQKANGLPADGKIGPHTVARAREVKARASEVAAAAPQGDARPRV